MSNLACQNLTASIKTLAGLKRDFDIYTIKESYNIPKANETKKQIEDMIIQLDIIEIGHNLELAKNSMGNDFLGPNEIKVAFSNKVEIDKIPPIPFSFAELRKAKELGQFLILRLPMTMKQIHGKLDGKLKNGRKILYASDGKTGQLENTAWYKNEGFFTDDIAQAGWALVSNEVLGCKDGNHDQDKTKVSTNKNYLEQTQVLINYLQNEVFKNKPVPAVYAEAIREFNSYLKAYPDFAAQVVNNEPSDWKEISAKLVSFKINQLTRQSPAEVLYDFIVYYQVNSERLFENVYIWTNNSSPDGNITRIGDADINGVGINKSRPSRHHDATGVSFSRTS